ncbi:MAG: carboxypeptidase M32 [Alphaproteobacteria bacterium]|nr:carboxypeptidase M32 [Alphaproteobacteria bacterium]
MSAETSNSGGAYKVLEQRFHRLSVLDQVGGILHWDQAVIMPDGAAAARAEQVSTLSVLSHELMTGPEMADLLAAADEAALEDWPAANLALMRRQHAHQTAVPADLVAARSKACSACEMAWRAARKDGDFAAVLPYLREVVRLTREMAQVKAAALGLSPYDALLDGYDPGNRAELIDPVFADLAGFLPGLLDDVLARQSAAGPLTVPQGPFPIDSQAALGRRLMQAVGFDFNRGRLDVSIHPFCGGATDDVRITTRYDEADFTQSLMGVLHETGHALYELGRPGDPWRNQPIGEARGMTVHESQSLLMEMQACRSRDFLHYAAPLIREAFGVEGPAYEVDALQRLYTRVSRGFIRVDADEVTYPLHVILRYRLERAIIAGDLDVADLPGVWNEGMRELLGVVPPNDRLGCLQDIHWYDGAIGYFPTYTLGALMAAQLFAAATEQDSDILPGIARGDFVPLVAWLRVNIHAHGSRYSADELLTRATGAPLGTAAFKAHLQRRYLGS